MELEMGTETRQRILDEIRESVRRPPGPDEVTTRMVAQADPDLDQDSARKILKQKVKDGIMYERDGVMPRSAVPPPPEIAHTRGSARDHGDQRGPPIDQPFHKGLPVSP